MERAYYLGRDTANAERGNVAATRHAAVGEAYGRAYAAMGQAYAAMRPATTAEAYGKAYAAMGEAYRAMDAATLERSNAAALAQYNAVAEYYAHRDLKLVGPAVGNGSVTSDIAPMGEYSAVRTTPSEKHVPGGGP
jgi:hypothetical protein